MRPCLIEIDWRAPERAFAPVAQNADALLLLSGGAHPRARWSYLCCEPVALWRWSEGDGGDPFARPRRTPRLAGGPGLPPFVGGWAGLLSYELGRAFERLPWPGGDRDGWPDVALGLYDTIAAFDHHAHRAFVLSWGLDAEGRPDPERAAWRARRLAEAVADRAPPAPAPLTPTPGPPAALDPVRPRARIEAAVAKTVALVRAGDIFQANLSWAFSGRLAAGDDPFAWFRRVAEASPAPFSAYLRLPDRAVVSQSPELFLSLDAGGLVQTAPIKGTRRRGANPLEDAALARALSESPKDRAENLMIVDLMRNDLARVCAPGSVSVPALCAPEHFAHVHHLVSTVQGRLRPGLAAWDVLAAAFPPGSVTGAPKVRAMEIIAEAEGEPRGPYCGSMAWIGLDGAMGSSVLIRTAACVRDSRGWRARVRAGGGIVADSDPADEAAEMETKARALRESVQPRLPAPARAR
jgi:para-aminobenzoate synthetase component 1